MVGHHSTYAKSWEEHVPIDVSSFKLLHDSTTKSLLMYLTASLASLASNDFLVNC